MQCSNPSKATDAFKGLDVVESRISNSSNISNSSGTNFDFSKIDNLLQELQKNIQSVSKDRNIKIENILKDNSDNLNIVSTEFAHLFNVFSYFTYLPECKDLCRVVSKVMDLSGQNIPKPDQSLLESDAVRY
jgi:hypothetical protein